MRKQCTVFAKVVFSFLFSLLVFRCEEIINPELPTSAPLLVVDGWVSDQANESYVKLSRSQPYNLQRPFEKISEALVTVTSESGEAVVFSEVEWGNYQPPVGFSGDPETTYTLKVVVDGSTIEAVAELPASPQVIGIGYSFVEGNTALENGYYPAISFELTENRDEFFFWRTYLNGQEVDIDRLNILTDEEFNNGQPVSDYLFYTEQPVNPTTDTVQISFSALSSVAYHYYEGLQILTEVGSPSQAVPQNPVSNLTGNAIGFFNCSPTVILVKLPE